MQYYKHLQKNVFEKQGASFDIMKKVFGKLTDGQLKFILPKALIADVLVYIAALPFYGFGKEIPLGLLLGTVTMTANLVLLGYSVERCVERGSQASAKRYMFSFYLIRLVVMGAALVWGFNAPYFNPVCVFLPLLWPKLIYTGSAIFKRKK